MNCRLPAYPLITHDPYFSCWCFTDNPADDAQKHWSDAWMNMPVWLDLDGKKYRLMGCGSQADKAPCAPQWKVTATRTVLTWDFPEIRLTVTFLTPALPDDLDVLSRPLTYIETEAESIDGKEHALRLMFTFDSTLTVPGRVDIRFGRFSHPDAQIGCMGAENQRVFCRAGDRIPIEWGYFYAAIPAGQPGTMRYGDLHLNLQEFKSGTFSPDDDFSISNNSNPRGIAIEFPANTGKTSRHSSYFCVSYDDLYAVEFLHQKLSPCWKRTLKDMGAVISAAVAGHEELQKRCTAFDEKLRADAEKAGGERYAFLCNATYRQAIAGHKLAWDHDGNLLFFSKENDSNGCIATVDVTYPSVPLFFRYAPELVEGMLRPIFEYAAGPRWKFDFAPHDLGTFPLANGQVYGGGEENEENQMPVEESGNLLILSAALLKYRPETTLVREYLPVLKKWANYLLEKGYDPENQLCTDDFAGHLAHNTNLSLKAIMALASYSRIMEQYGTAEEAEKFRKTAEEFAARWVVEADDGDHYRLAFDQPGTWSLKYNLFWDKLLGFNLFPPEVAEKEIAYYKKMQNTYGVPLDNRAEYTKCDWLLWVATLTGKREDFDAFVEPVCRWLNESPDRMPMSDWYFTTGEGKVRGFRARTVVGGLFAGLL
ncbi:MAG: DUF4965 domain-containing protein [Lentisphaeria bacterium]|nr:DUF4965 domain-containing protein [Lentisphaeria bacterium]